MRLVRNLSRRCVRAFFASLFRRWDSACFSQDPPRCGDSPSVKTKISAFLQLFCDYGLFPILAKREWVLFAADFLHFRVPVRDRGPRTIPNRKKVAIWAVILFLGFRSRLGAARERHTRHRLPYGKESGAMGRA